MFLKINKLRKFGRLITSLNGFIYDYLRFVLYSGWIENLGDKELRNYHLVKIYHALEKSMSFKNRDPASGWKAAHLLFSIIKNKRQKKEYGFHDKASFNVLNKFINLPENISTDKAKILREDLSGAQIKTDQEHGCKNYALSDFRRGLLSNPEDFFGSRYSLREFRDEVVPETIIKKAVSLSLKTPSVCNRQAWHVYHTSDPGIKSKALSYQSGNRGFGERIPNLLVITTDLKAFMSGEEHYQHWIDGGMFSMSLVYAFHSLGVASCCLNWSRPPSKDKALRKNMNIRNNHTVIMMLAIGWPAEMNNVCVSARRPLSEFLTKLEEKSNNK